MAALPDITDPSSPNPFGTRSPCRKAPAVCLSIVFLLCPPLSATGDSKAPLILSLAVDKSVFSAAEPVVVRVTVTNTSNEVHVLPSAMAHPTYMVQFRVRDSQGQLIADRGLRPTLYLTQFGVELNPGYFWGRTFDLQRIYELQPLMSYTVEAVYYWRYADDAPDHFKVLSNTVEVMVLPEAAQQ